MRAIVMLLACVLLFAAAALLVSGIISAAPGEPDFMASTAAQALSRKWMLARGFQELLLAGTALIAALAALILRALIPPTAETTELRGLAGLLERLAAADASRQRPTGDGRVERRT
nr:hypothetical protein [uncultured Roseococcus sp.]